jgi:hypothetical protein
MSVNHRFAINPEKTKKLGKLFHTIDFSTNEDFNMSEVKENYKNVPAGTFSIGGNDYKVTVEELNYIAETARRGSEVLSKKLKLGMFY